MIAEYRRRHAAEPAPRLAARIATDRSLGLAATLSAEKKSRQRAPVYLYEFAFEPGLFDGVIGAAHSMDLAFVFGTVASIPYAGERPERHRVSAEVRNAWLSFAETGVPRDPGGGAFPECSVDTGRRRIVIDAAWSTAETDDPRPLAARVESEQWLAGGRVDKEGSS